MKNRFKARVDKLEQRVTPKRKRIYRWLEDSEEASAVLDRMIAAGEITEDQRDRVLFVSWCKPRLSCGPMKGRLSARLILVGVDLYGADIAEEPLRDISLEECKSTCLGDIRCRAFTFNDKARACFLKTGIGEQKSFVAATSGIRKRLDGPQSKPSTSGAEANSKFFDVEFVFSGKDVRALGYPNAHVNVGEEVGVAELKMRFSAFTHTLTDECEGFCLLIGGKNARIDVYFDPEYTKVQGIVSWCGEVGEVADTNVATCGASLIDATGSLFLHCEKGEHDTCQSPHISGLSYITGQDSGCKIEVRAGGQTPLPRCAKIEGFEIWRQ